MGARLRSARTERTNLHGAGLMKMRVGRLSPGKERGESAGFHRSGFRMDLLHGTCALSC